MRDATGEKGPGRTAMVDVYSTIKTAKTGMFDKPVNDFIKGLPSNGYLGDAFASEERRNRYATPLADYVAALVDELRERGTSDTVAPTSTPQQLQPGERLTLAHKQHDFGTRRNEHFLAAVANAATNGIRYAGMGKDHFDALKREGQANGWHFYDMMFDDLARFESRTRQLRDQAEGH